MEPYGTIIEKSKEQTGLSLGQLGNAALPALQL